MIVNMAHFYCSLWSEWCMTSYCNHFRSFRNSLLQCESLKSRNIYLCGRYIYFLWSIYLFAEPTFVIHLKCVFGMEVKKTQFIPHAERIFSEGCSCIQEVALNVYCRYSVGSQEAIQVLVGSVVCFISELKSMPGLPYLIMHRFWTKTDLGFDTRAAWQTPVSTNGMLSNLILSSGFYAVCHHHVLGLWRIG